MYGGLLKPLIDKFSRSQLKNLTGKTAIEGVFSSDDSIDEGLQDLVQTIWKFFQCMVVF